MSSVFGAGSGPNEQKSSTSTNEVLIKKEVSVIPTGIPGFDEAIGQGLPAGNLYLVSGTLGSSSIQLVQEILYNTLIAKGKVTYYTVEDSSTDIIQDMKISGMNIGQFVDEGSWRFGRVIPPNMKKVLDALPEVPMEQRIFLDESFTDLMNHYYDTVKDGHNTAIHFPVLVRNYSLDEIQNLLFYMKGIVRRYGGIHFILLTEGAHAENTMITMKDTADSVFEVISSARGSDVENSVAIKKIRSMIPKSRMVRLTIRNGRLATETIRRIQ